MAANTPGGCLNFFREVPNMGSRGRNTDVVKRFRDNARMGDPVEETPML